MSLDGARGGRTRRYGRYREDPVIEGPDLAALAAWSGMARLRSLALSGNDARRNGLRALLRSPHVTGLKELTLRANGLDGQAMQEFGAARPCVIPRDMSKGTLLHRQLVDPELVVQRHVGGSRCCL